MKPIVALITSNDRDRSFPSHVPLDPAEEETIERPSFILCHDLQTVELDALDPVPLGELSFGAMMDMDAALAITLGLADLPD
jgi:mRNA-degrading endonuclease toxin of MazEF toxin-antitoxin module